MLKKTLKQCLDFLLAIKNLDFLLTMRKEPKFPIFELGAGRSGTTLLQRILNSHNNVFVWGEHGGFLKEIADSYFMNFENPIITKCLSLDKKLFLRECLRLKNPRRNPYWTNYYDLDTLKNNYRNFIESFFKPNLLKHSHWGFKEIRYGINDRVLDMLIDLYPYARFIFIIRDPFYVLRSQVIAWRSKKITNEHISFWNIQNKFFLKFCKKHPQNCFMIKYEDLILKESDKLEELFNWLGFTISEVQYKILNIQINSKFKITETPKHFFNKSELDLINKKTYGLRKEMGYS